MCIGIPMQVLHTEPGHAVCVGRGQQRRVRTALVGAVAAGDWLLVFIDTAQTRLDTRQAQEINATLDLLQAALQGDDTLAPPPAFVLPSSWTAAQLRALAGAAPTTVVESTP